MDPLPVPSFWSDRKDSFIPVMWIRIGCNVDLDPGFTSSALAWKYQIFFTVFGSTLYCFMKKHQAYKKSKKSEQPDIWISVIYGFQMSEFWLFTVFLAWAAAFA